MVYNGHRYDSKLEASYAIELDWKLKAGEILGWKPQHKFELIINGIHWRDYKIDFMVTNINGIIDYIELKGFPTPEWKQKWDITIILFDELTKGESARLFLNNKLIKQSL